MKKHHDVLKRIAVVFLKNKAHVDMNMFTVDMVNTKHIGR